MRPHPVISQHQIIANVAMSLIYGRIKKWLTDLTDIVIPAGKVYVSPIVDCFDGLIVAWRIGTRSDAQLVNTMLSQAVQTLLPDEHPIIHSDCGAHYRWPEWIRRTDSVKLVRSMFKKGC